MAEIEILNRNNGDIIPVSDIELDLVTNTELIFQLVANGMVVPEVPGAVYKMLGKNNQPVEETATLAELGVNDGDTVAVVAKFYC